MEGIVNARSWCNEPPVQHGFAICAILWARGSRDFHNVRAESERSAWRKRLAAECLRICRCDTAPFLAIRQPLSRRRLTTKLDSGARISLTRRTMQSRGVVGRVCLGGPPRESRAADVQKGGIRYSEALHEFRRSSSLRSCENKRGIKPGLPRPWICTVTRCDDSSATFN